MAVLLAYSNNDVFGNSLAAFGDLDGDGEIVSSGQYSVEDQLAKNSPKQPPASDGLKKKQVVASTQRGRPCHTLERVAHPDSVKLHVVVEQ